MNTPWSIDAVAPGRRGQHLFATFLVGLGFAMFVASIVVPGVFGQVPWSATVGTGLALGTVGLMAIGVFYLLVLSYVGDEPGIRNDGVWFRGLQNRGLLGWFAAVVFTTFYVVLYWYGEVLVGPIRALDPLAQLMTGGPADRWFLYGTMYSALVLVFGVRTGLRYRHQRYQLLRTLSVVVFQLGFAWLLPYLLKRLHQPEYYVTYFWPLKPDYAYPPGHGGYLFDAGWVGAGMVAISALLILVVTPILTYFYGKRWFCSWVCGCGGLAETLGDPWRHLSDNSLTSWRVERVSIHVVLLLVLVTTGLLWADWGLGTYAGQYWLGGYASGMRSWYGFIVVSMFSGVIGVGVYPLLGSRVWCRFGCPMAAILGLQQRFFSRFRITTNGGQCISCGNCSVYCEMGIDVRDYAQREQNIVRASCVGCGICAAVCPRGVLKLENGPVGDRFELADKPLSALLEALGQPPLGDLRPPSSVEGHGRES